MSLTQEDREELAHLIETVETRTHHKMRKRTWYERLALSGLVTVALIVTAKLMHLELAFKGAELVLGAAAHWLFFGTAD